MMSCRLIWLVLTVLVVIVRKTCLSEPLFPSMMANGTGWDVLEAASKHIYIDDGVMIADKEYYSYYIWNLYNISSRVERPKYVKEMSEKLKQIAYRDFRHDMIGSILFGPEKARSILRSRVDYGKLDVGDDYFQCLETTVDLYMKHCGPLPEDGLKHTESISNMCLYVEDMAAIKDAIIFTCGMNNVAPSGIDVRNPRTDVIPAPFHGYTEYCGRVSVNAISRMELQSYAKAYEVMFEPVVSGEWHDKIQICFHWNASRDLCHCEKDEWRYINRGSWDYYVSAYEEKFVDVKFDSGVYGFVTVSLREDVLLERCHYASLAGGALLLFIAGFDNNDWALNWVLRVPGVVAIYLSSFDTLLALVAVASCSAVSYVTFIIFPMFKKTELLPMEEEFTADWTQDTPGFQGWMLKNHRRIIVSRHYSNQN